MSGRGGYGGGGPRGPPRGGPPGGGYGGGGPGGPGGRGPGGPGRGPGGPGGPGGGRGGGGGGGGGMGGEMAVNNALQAVAFQLGRLELRAAPTAYDPTSQVPYQRARRPGFGTQGKAVNVLANHFRLDLKAKQAFHYDVAITAMDEAGPPRPGARPARPPRRQDAVQANRPLPRPLVRRVLSKLAETEKWPPGWACDWAKSMYAPTAMFGDSAGAQPHETAVRVVVDLPDGVSIDKTFKVVIKYAATYDLGALERHVRGEQSNGLEAEEEAAGGLRAALQVLDVVLRSGISARDNVVTVGSAVLFNAPGTELYSNLGRGAEAWAGYKQAVKVTQDGLAVVLDLAAGAFVKAGPLLDIAADLLGRPPPDLARSGLSERDLRSLSRELKGVRVVVERQGGKAMRKTVWGLSKTGADRTMFFYEPQKKEISVVAYFQVAYGIALKAPRLPCVNVSKDPSKVVWLPMEMCRILPGQRKRMLQDERHTTAMLRFAGLKPRERSGYLRDVVSNPALANFNAEPAVQKFGMRVSPDMVTVKGRVLDPPKLAYGKPEALDPGTSGAWNLRSVKFPVAATIASWACLSLMDQSEVDLAPGHAQGLATFVNELVHMCNDCGMRCPTPPIVHFDRSFSVSEHVQYAMEQAEGAFDGKKCQLVLVLLPSKGKDTYQAVKQAGDSECSVPTQCFVAAKAGVGRSSPPPKGRMQYAANLALKINTKVGGTNVKLLGDLRNMPVLGGGQPYMISADVTHPTGFDTSEPSIAAVTASYDASLGRYSCRVMQQAHRQEIITGLQGATQALLLNFYKRSKRKPAAIVYYRDGVDQGQFAAVLQEEYTAIRAACQALEADYTPRITFVVVQKRHATRLFPSDRSGEDRSGNTLPGTVIDAGICSAAGFDFYLNSHAGLQGHNKASHYQVLVDENGFSADGLELLTYWLCYLYSRCTRSVSYPPPCYLAHLAAFRGRLMLDVPDSGSESSRGSGGGKPRPLLTINDDYSDACMFYI
ncbi:hypothetical protein Rsub_07737 [Raphidocelis subcapitata]|uniref:Uncharacterized protein n=1 Tax=Raphidocelis subcapitata TaxID=307507 RepID=A0A2V0PB80_9CHLO|nr:hypothetical protein Rsub_07737 [Raphidocelis subcapitata]|eukprot:GBF95153.1 hypothetical protein Rsub_07737 [Raphidocelis subcapitata]